MRIEIFLCLLATAAYVYSESCTDNADCTVTQCNGNLLQVICEHSSTGGAGLCTCAAANVNCTTRSDCLTTDMQTILNCPSMDSLHCYDARCICTRWR